MSLPTQANLTALNYGADGEPFALLAPSASIDTRQLGWGVDGDAFNYAPSTGVTVVHRVMQMIVT